MENISDATGPGLRRDGAGAKAVAGIVSGRVDFTRSGGGRERLLP